MTSNELNPTGLEELITDLRQRPPTDRELASARRLLTAEWSVPPYDRRTQEALRENPEGLLPRARALAAESTSRAKALLGQGHGPRAARLSSAISTIATPGLSAAGPAAVRMNRSNTASRGCVPGARANITVESAISKTRIAGGIRISRGRCCSLCSSIAVPSAPQSIPQGHLAESRGRFDIESQVFIDRSTIRGMVNR